MQIHQDFGIAVPGGLALSIDKYSLPLCSSTAVLRDDDVLTVSLSSGAEVSLQVSMIQETAAYNCTIIVSEIYMLKVYRIKESLP